tara:strand:+ start:513 stop:842 length:330 start_codon:yes stop_codon:yes gene_type:complete
MIILSPAMLSSDRADRLNFDQETGSSDRRNDESRQQSKNDSFCQERLRSSTPSSIDNRLDCNLPKLGDALKNLYAGRLKAEISNTSGRAKLMRNSNLIAERVLHFTSNQ